MGDFVDGTVVWYSEDFSRGVVKLDTGRQFIFRQIEDLEGVEARLRVLVKNSDAGSAGVIVTGYPDGRREFAAEEVIAPPSSSRRPRSRKKAEPAYLEGASVHHKSWGQGFVVSATAKMARVRFTDTGEERSVRVSGLNRLDGSQPEAKA